MPSTVSSIPSPTKEVFTSPLLDATPTPDKMLVTPSDPLAVAALDEPVASTGLGLDELIDLVVSEVIEQDEGPSNQSQSPFQNGPANGLIGFTTPASSGNNHHTANNENLNITNNKLHDNVSPSAASLKPHGVAAMSKSPPGDRITSDQEMSVASHHHSGSDAPPFFSIANNANDLPLFGHNSASSVLSGIHSESYTTISNSCLPPPPFPPAATSGIDQLAPPPAPAAAVGNVYVANLRTSTDAARIRAFFQTFGQVLHVKLLLDIATGVSRCIAFVMFANFADALQACSLASKADLDGAVIQVRMAQRGTAVGLDTHVYSPIVFLRNVPAGTFRKDVKAYCEATYGRVKNLTLHPQSNEVGGPSPFNMMVIEFHLPEQASLFVEGTDGRARFPVSAGHPLLMAKMITNPAAEMRKSILLRPSPGSSTHSNNCSLHTSKGGGGTSAVLGMSSSNSQLLPPQHILPFGPSSLTTVAARNDSSFPSSVPMVGHPPPPQATHHVGLHQQQPFPQPYHHPNHLPAGASNQHSTNTTAPQPIGLGGGAGQISSSPPRVPASSTVATPGMLVQQPFQVHPPSPAGVSHPSTTSSYQMRLPNGDIVLVAAHQQQQFPFPIQQQHQMQMHPQQQQYLYQQQQYQFQQHPQQVPVMAGGGMYSSNAMPPPPPPPLPHGGTHTLTTSLPPPTYGSHLGGGHIPQQQHFHQQQGY